MKGCFSHTWNDDDRLVAVTTPEGNSIAYDYDDEGIRVSATVDGETTEFLVDKNRPYAQVLEEFSSDQLQTFYVYGHDLISQTRNAEQDFYQVDGLGSTRALADEEGNVTDTYDYEAFGELIDSTGDSENSYRFTGEQFDADLGDYYLRQRFYGTGTGRFLRRDVYEGRRIEPITLHKYLYGNSDPVNHIDPTGYFAISNVYAVAAITTILVTVTSDIFFPNPLQTPTNSGDFYGPNPYKGPYEIVAGFLLGLGLTRFLSNSASVAVYRVEGAVNTRVAISSTGDVAILEKGKMLFLNFGQRGRALEFYLKRISQGVDDVSIKSFKVPRSFLNEIREEAVDEAFARQFPNKPIRVDVTKAPDQFGLRKEQVDQLTNVILEGSGKINKP
ncbi:MAG: hypothetical protein F6K30_29020 [Cyanothece sp. SIO2G6]|nr:hypothetical protein [Cyanothece sp. SIO2G6]